MAPAGRVLLAVTALCGLVQGAPAARNAPAASTAVAPVGAFFFDAQGASGSRASLASVFTPDERNAPGALDREAAWQRYYAHLMAPTRSAPFVVLFTDDPEDACGVPSEEEEEEDGDPPRDDAQRTAECQQLRETTAAVTRYVRGLVAAEGFPSRELLPVVRISKQEFPQAFTLHRVPSTPSLLWLPPRATGKLQRRAHRQTNFLALPSAPPVDVAAVAQDVTGFLHRCYAQSGLGFPSSGASTSPPRGRGRGAPAQNLPSVVTVAAHGLGQDDSLAERIINTLPFLAIGLYALLTAMQHRAAVLKVVRSRFTWLVLAQGVLYVSLSGLFHSIIHRVGAFYAHPQYGVYFIHPSGRKQFFLEGLVNGGWSFAISFALFSIANVMPAVKSRFAREEIFRWALLVVGVAYMGLHLVFTAKHPWLSR